MGIRPSRIYAVSLALGILLAYGVSVLSPERTSVWDGLFSDETQLVLVMTPANCAINGAEIHRLNEVAATSRIPIRGVFVSQVDANDRDRVLDMFGFNMPITFDVEERWANAIVTTGLPTQVAIVARRGRVQHVAPVDKWESLLAETNAIPATIGLFNPAG